MNCNILFFVRTFNHSFKHLICPISKHILRQDCPVVNVSLATVLFHNGKGNLFFLTLVRMTGLVVSKANVIAKRANLFATVKRLRKTNCACRTTVLCTDTTCFICLLCPLRSMSANALRLRLSSSTVYAKQICACRTAVPCTDTSCLFVCYVRFARCPQMLSRLRLSSLAVSRVTEFGTHSVRI